jgi:hypothetical protein
LPLKFPTLLHSLAGQPEKKWKKGSQSAEYIPNITTRGVMRKKKEVPDVKITLRPKVLKARKHRPTDQPTSTGARLFESAFSVGLDLAGEGGVVVIDQFQNRVLNVSAI